MTFSPAGIAEGARRLAPSQPSSTSSLIALLAGSDRGSDLVWRVPPFDLSRVLTEWGLAPVPLVLTVWAAGLYLVGVRTLKRRGDAWPVGRTVMFVGVGMGLFYLATSSGLAAYDTTLLSVHMVQHMVLSMLVPLALALGAPVTLALRTLRAGTAALAARRSCTRGSRRCCPSRH